MDLPWTDVEPRTHAFDVDAVHMAIIAAVQPFEGAFQNAPRNVVEAAIHRAIVETAGPWAAGWRWSPSEPGGGGPAHGWCCASDSVFRDDDGDPRATVDRALGAVVDWRGVLETLAAMFAMLRIETAGLTVDKEIERVASRVLAYAVDRTSAEDAWYNTFGTMMRWYVEAAGFTDPAAIEAVAAAAAGQFASWIAPSEPQALAAVANLGAIAGDQLGEGDLRDALADWCELRTRPLDLPEHEHPPAERDGHCDFIVDHDLPRDQDRGERMAAALLLCRDSAVRGMALTFDQLAEWQRVVLGAAGPVPLRTTDAFAKQGRECYRWSPDLRERLDAALADAADPALSVAVRAARVYLDVCFFHPFPDGNARAARLALDHVVTSAQLVLATAEPVIKLVRGADDPHGLWALAFVIDRALASK